MELLRFEIQYTVIKYKGKCYRNTNRGPACTEELACVKAAEMLLLDENDNFLPDDEAIFL